jgi:hypothetical protein
MDLNEVDVQTVKDATNLILDRILERMRSSGANLRLGGDMYWTVTADDLFALSKSPGSLNVGSLNDDLEFTRLLTGAEAASENSPVYNLIHIAPILRAIAEAHRRTEYPEP